MTSLRQTCRDTADDGLIASISLSFNNLVKVKSNQKTLQERYQYQYQAVFRGVKHKFVKYQVEVGLEHTPYITHMTAAFPVCIASEFEAKVTCHVNIK